MPVNKYICQILVGYLTVLSYSLVSTEYVPVYIWESSKSNEIVPALPRISQETFKEIIQEKLDKKSFVVVFAEPNLSSEDFGEVDSSGNKVFSHLSDIKATTTYLPLVDDPVDVVKSIYNNDVSQTTLKDFDIENIESSVLIVDLDDIEDNETRNEILQRHDESIFNIYEKLQKQKGDVFAILTAYHTSWIIPEIGELSRQTRSILATRDDTTRKSFVTENLLLYISDTANLTIRTAVTDLSNHNLSSETTNDTLTAELSSPGESSVEMIFTFAAGYWTLSNVTVTDATDNNRQYPLRPVDVYAPYEFSFQCTSQVFHQRNGTVIVSLSLPGMQVQPFRQAAVNLTFGDPYYCVGFTTAPIWSGIFVTAILVTIMAIGLSMMMDIRTMDRFDDPKGKTIQINVSE